MDTIGAYEAKTHLPGCSIGSLGARAWRLPGTAGRSPAWFR